MQKNKAYKIFCTNNTVHSLVVKNKYFFIHIFMLILDKHTKNAYII